MKAQQLHGVNGVHMANTIKNKMTIGKRFQTDLKELNAEPQKRRKLNGVKHIDKNSGPNLNNSTITTHRLKAGEVASSSILNGNNHTVKQVKGDRKNLKRFNDNRMIMDASSTLESVKPLSENKGKLSKYIKDQISRKLLRKRGIKTLFEIQTACYQPIIDGRDVIGQDRTGSGKTLAYALPLTEKFRSQGLLGQQKPIVLVLVPTRELVIQIAQEFSCLSHDQNEIKVVSLYGGAEIYEQSVKLRQGATIVVATPGRLLDMHRRGHIKYDMLEALVIDEADEMWNKGFCDDVNKIIDDIKSQTQPRNIQKLFFSATIPSWLQSLCDKTLTNRIHINLIKGGTTRTSMSVRHLALQCPNQALADSISNIMLCYRKNQSARCIIFCETKNQVNQLYLNCKQQKEMQILHGDIPQKQREITFKGFGAGQFPILVATNVAARGLDFPEVDLIIQLSPPKDADTYIHRAGRTARAGKDGICVTFYNKWNQQQLQWIEREAKIVFQKIGSPQPNEIIEAISRNIINQFALVSDTSIEQWRSFVTEYLEENDPIEALAKAFAVLSGFTEAPKQRSLLCAIEGYITYTMRFSQDFHSVGFAWNALRAEFPSEIVSQIKGLRRISSSNDCVFDLPQEYEAEIGEFMAKKSNFSRFTIEKTVDLPDIDEEQAQQPFRPQSNGRKFEKTPRKAEMDIFVGGWPFSCTESDIEQFFTQKGLSISYLKLVKGPEGNFKGACFCQISTQEQYEKALALNGSYYNARCLKINPAGNKPTK